MQGNTITLTNSDNIETLDGNNFDLKDDDIIIMQFDVTDNKWQQVTAGKEGIGSFLPLAGGTMTGDILVSGVVDLADTTDRFSNISIS